VLGVRPGVAEVEVQVDFVAFAVEAGCEGEGVGEVVVAGGWGVDPDSGGMVYWRLLRRHATDVSWKGNPASIILRLQTYLNLTEFIPPSPRISSAGLVTLPRCASL
jgi:hypothetical protein